MFSSTGADPPPSLTLSADVPRNVNKIPECVCLNGCSEPGAFADVNEFLAHVLAWHSDDLARFSKVYPDCLIADYELDDIEPLLRVIWPLKQPIHVRSIKDVSRLDAASDCQELVLGRIIRCRGYGMNQAEARMAALLHGILLLVSGTIEGLAHPFTWKLANAGFPPLTEAEVAVLKTPLAKKLTHFTVPKGVRHFARGGFYRLNNLIKMYPEEHKELVVSGYFKTHIHRKVEELLLNIVKVDFPMYFTAESATGSHVRVIIETDYVTLYGDGKNVLAARYNALRHLVYLAIAGHEPSAWREIMPKPTPLLSAARPRYLRPREEPGVAPVRHSIHDWSPSRADSLSARQPSSERTAAHASHVSSQAPPPHPRPPSPDRDLPLCFGRSTFKLAPLPPASPARAATIPTPSVSPHSARTNDFTSRLHAIRDRDQYQVQQRPAAAPDQVPQPGQSQGKSPVPSQPPGRAAAVSPPPALCATATCPPPQAAAAPDAASADPSAHAPKPATTAAVALAAGGSDPSSTVPDPHLAPANASAAPPPPTATPTAKPAGQTGGHAAPDSAPAAALSITQLPQALALDTVTTAAPAGRPTYDQLMADLNATRTWALSLSTRVTHLETQVARLHAQPTSTSTTPNEQPAATHPTPHNPALDPSNPYHRHLLLTPLHTPAGLPASLGPTPPELAHLDPAHRAQLLTHPLLSTWLDDPLGAMQVAVWQRTGVYLGLECLLVVPMGMGATGMPLWLASVSVDGKGEEVATGTSEGAAVRGVTARVVLGIE